MKKILIALGLVVLVLVPFVEATISSDYISTNTGSKTGAFSKELAPMMEKVYLNGWRTTPSTAELEAGSGVISLNVESATDPYLDVQILNKSGVGYYRRIAVTDTTSTAESNKYLLKTGGTLSGILTTDAVDVPTGKTVNFNMALGTAPFTVVSSTGVTNLNADRLDTYHASSFLLLSGGTMTGKVSTEALDVPGTTRLLIVPAVTPSVTTGTLEGSVWYDSANHKLMVFDGTTWEATW